MKYSFTDRFDSSVEIEIESHPDVLNPSMYARRFSEVLISRDLAGKKVLDLGCGSGILSIVSAIIGAVVHSVDISPASIKLTKNNARINGVQIESCQESDLFSIYEDGGHLFGEKFDIIIANHPSLPGKSSSDRDRNGVVEWNQNGNGRVILDAVLDLGNMFLSEGGSIITHSSSEQGWGTTLSKLTNIWPYWRTLIIEELPISGTYYAGVVEEWVSSGCAYKKNGGEIFHELRIIEVAQMPFNSECSSGDCLLNFDVLSGAHQMKAGG